MQYNGIAARRCEHWAGVDGSAELHDVTLAAADELTVAGVGGLCQWAACSIGPMTEPDIRRGKIRQPIGTNPTVVRQAAELDARSRLAEGQTRCRDDGARAQVSRQSHTSRPRDWSARRVTLIGTLRWRITLCYSTITDIHTGNPPYSIAPYLGVRR